MINEQKEKADMFRVLSELQKIQRAFLFDTPLSISVFYQEKGMYINAGIPDPNKENPKAAFGQAWRFESFRDKEDFDRMLDEIRKTLIAKKANKFPPIILDK